VWRTLLMPGGVQLRSLPAASGPGAAQRCGPGCPRPECMRPAARRAPCSWPADAACLPCGAHPWLLCWHPLGHGPAGPGRGLVLASATQRWRPRRTHHLPPAACRRPPRPAGAGGRGPGQGLRGFLARPASTRPCWAWRPAAGERHGLTRWRGPCRPSERSPWPGLRPPASEAAPPSTRRWSSSRRRRQVGRCPCCGPGAPWLAPGRGEEAGRGGGRSAARAWHVGAV
jgi:hypothetical protein